MLTGLLTPGARSRESDVGLGIRKYRCQIFCQSDREAEAESEREEEVQTEDTRSNDHSLACVGGRVAG